MPGAALGHQATAQQGAEAAEHSGAEGTERPLGAGHVDAERVVALRAGRDEGDPCRRVRSLIRNGYPADGARRDSAQSGSVPRSQVDSMPLSALAARRRYEA